MQRIPAYWLCGTMVACTVALTENERPPLPIDLQVECVPVNADYSPRMNQTVNIEDRLAAIVRRAQNSQN